MTTVTLGGREWHFHPPTLPVQMDLMMALGTNKPRTCAAAIGLCLFAGPPSRNGAAPEPFVKNLRYLDCGCSPLLYGGVVMEQLQRREIPISEWISVGLQCLDEVARLYNPITAEEIEQAEDFTEASEAPS